MRFKIWSAALLALVATAVLAAPAGAKAKPRYYLALGDSLSVGFQPLPSGAGVETSHGYANDLFAAERKKIPGLKLVELGCPGESTTSMLTGRGNTAAAKQYKCVKTGGSQLKAAERWLKAHHARGEVPLITIDIGANDVDGCVTPSFSLTCVTAGVKSIAANTPKLLAGIGKAAPKGTTFAGMSLYDPFLAAYLNPYSALYPLAEESVTLAQQVNAAISAADKAARFKTADVFDAFKTSVTTAAPGTSIPTNVAEICALTWMCANAPQGPNIHANRAGYGVIAGAFRSVVGKLK
jgi:lysophospholipase L1-like esterase